MTTSKTKSTIHTKLADGTKIKEHTVEETHPDGTKVITTTIVKTFSKRKTLPDGSQVMENVTTTTTTTKELQTVKTAPPELLSAAVNAVGTFMDIFTSPIKCDGGDQGEEEDDQSKVNKQHHQEDEYDNNSLGASTLGVSTLGGWTAETMESEIVRPSRNNNNEDNNGGNNNNNKALSTTKKKVRRPSEVSNSTPQQKHQHRRPSISSNGNKINREILNLEVVSTSTPQQQNQQKHQHQQPYQPYPPQQNQARQSSKREQPQQQQPTQQQQASPAFFQKTYPSSARNLNDNNGYGTINNTNNHGYNDLEVQTEDLETDDDGGSIDNSFRLYESDRCEELPVFHKVNNNQPNDIRKNRSGGGRVGRSIIRSYSNTAHNVNKNITLGLSSASRNRKKKSRDKNELDPDVINAIALIRQRSKSPPRDRRRQHRQQRQQQQQQQQSRQPSPAQHKLQSIARQPTPQSRQPAPTNSRTAPSTYNYKAAQQQALAMEQQQAQQHQALARQQPSQQIFTNQPPPMTSISAPKAVYNSRQAAPQAGQFHPHESSLDRLMNSGQNNQQQAHTEFDGLPLGDLANPIQWDDYSEMRDDSPTVLAVAPAGAAYAAAQPSPRGAPPRQKSQRGRAAGMRQGSSSRLKMRGQSKTKKKDQPPPPAANATKNASKNPIPRIPPPTLVKHNQALLPRDSTTIISDPKITIHKTNAILTSDKYVHFYTFTKNQWIQTTTVSLQNTHNLTLALSRDTAVIGVPYDRNSKGLLTGSAYIFERDNKTHTWYQVKKIVPKKVQEYATVGYSVDICDNVVVVGVPELGGGNGGGGVYVYQRAEQFKWVPMGHLTTMDSNAFVDPNLSPAPAVPTSKFGTIVALRAKILVVSNYQPNQFSSDTSLFVYEYDATLKNKWKLIQTDLLSTEGQRRHFGSHIALTVDGEGIFIGCHSEVNPTEILYYRRKNQMDVYGNRSYQLQQIITVQERCDIADFKVDGQSGNFILGTLNSNRVYIYQQLYDLNTMEDQGWRMVCKVVNGGSNENIEKFGSNVGMFGDTILVGSKNNVYSYSLEGWKAAKKKNKKKDKQLASSSQLRSSSSGRRFMSSMSPMRFRRSSGS